MVSEKVVIYKRLVILILDLINDASREFPPLPPSFQQAFTEEDALSRDLKQAEYMLANRLDALIYQLHSARYDITSTLCPRLKLSYCSLTDIVDRVESRIRILAESEFNFFHLTLLEMNFTSCPLQGFVSWKAVRSRSS